MKKFIEKLEENSVKFAERLAVALDYKTEALTYREFWNLSGKVYSYLKENNIGREDFVLINLPRGPKIIVALIGIWRAGAAGIITEKGYPAERVEYIKKDSNAKIVIDENIYSEMLSCESLNGYEKTDPNDACFAVYTSGTTGNPKGALHEYGKLELIVRSFPKSDFEYSEICRHAASYPLNFVVLMLRFVPFFYSGNSFYILSYEIIKDVKAFNKFIAEENISETFMSPSLLKVYKNIPSNLRLIYTGSDNVSDIYFPNVILKNGYAMSETGFCVASFAVDKPYHRTPIGKNNFGLEILILNEDGENLSNGEQGEVCFENKYFRGYINLPEQTEKVFRDGIFYTGDWGYKDENGNLVIIGRKDDMIKIHGNRIEPTEIEIAAKEILGVNNIIAKGFSGESSEFVALYGLTSEIGDRFDEKNIPELREKLSKRLPDYMIPTYYITLEKFPLNANGKVSRKLFPAPETKNEVIEYVPPVTESEKIICEKMAAVLGIKKMGRNFDFYQMGGDSLKTVLFVTECNEFAIQSSDVYKYRTPEKLASFCDANKNLAVDKKKFSYAKAMKEKFFPKIINDYENYLKTGVISSVYSSCFASNEDNTKKISMSPSIEISLRNEIVNYERLQYAVNRAVEVYPYAAFDIFKHNGLIHFKKNNLPLMVHKIGTIEEFGTEKNNNHYVLVSFENEKINFSVSHILTDGFGINCFIQAVMNFYFGNVNRPEILSEKFDFTADLMSQDLPLPENYEPKNYYVRNHFVLPEINNSGTHEAFIEISAKKFEDFCNKYKISGQIAVSVILADAVQTAHPENEKIISVRCPINTRILLQVPNTFQNASIPHIFLNIDPKISNLDEKFENLRKDFSEQYTYENLAAFTNKVSGFIKAENPEERKNILLDYKNQTEIFANFMGKVLNDEIAKSIKLFRQKAQASYPLMMYVIQYGEIIVLQVIQSFSSPIYTEKLLKVLKKYNLQ